MPIIDYGISSIVSFVKKKRKSMRRIATINELHEIASKSNYLKFIFDSLALFFTLTSTITVKSHFRSPSLVSRPKLDSLFHSYYPTLTTTTKSNITPSNKTRTMRPKVRHPSIYIVYSVFYIYKYVCVRAKKLSPTVMHTII